MKTISENPGIADVMMYLSKLESRIKNLEDKLSIRSETESAEFEQEVVALETEVDSAEVREDRLEYKIGQFWLAKAGIVVLILGLAFLLTLEYDDFPRGTPVIFGLLISAGLYLLSSRAKADFLYLAPYFLGGSLVLLYFTTLRLHYFGMNPILSNHLLETVILFSLSLSALIFSLTKRYNYLTIISLVCLYISAMVSSNSYSIFILLALISALTVWIQLKYDWDNLLLVGIFLAYLVHLLWFVNNPIITGNIETVLNSSWNILFVFIYTGVFLTGNYLKSISEVEENSAIFNNMIIVAAGYGLFTVLSLIQRPGLLAFYHLFPATLFLFFALLFWKKYTSKFSTFILAMAGYLALTIAIVVQFNIPDFFIWLCWQSLIVLSTAVWFKSKFIVVANFFIYLALILAYLATEGKIDIVSISYGIVALISARILNWQKDRLELKTEYMRNLYLLIALLIIPYALYNVMPSGYVGIAWVVLAVIYYLMSIMLKNKKYRWMSLLTLLLTVGYVFILGISSSSTIFKILSFIILGSVMIAISIIYSKNKMKSDIKQS